MRGIIMLEDDVVIKALLVQHGKATQLEPRPDDPTPFRYHVIWREDPFFYGVSRFCGFEEDYDNGYSAILIPVALNTTEEAIQIFQHFWILHKEGDIRLPGERAELLDCAEVTKQS